MKSKSESKTNPPSRSIAKGPDAQRAAIQDERKKGSFNAKKHIEESPIGKAIDKGFPLIPR